jgi:PAS domain S-box-containing protein
MMAKHARDPLSDVDTSVAYLKAAASNSFDSILITDASRQGKIIYANPAFKKLTGHEPKSVIGETPKILQGSATDSKVVSRLAACLKAGKKFEGKAINYKKDGTPFIMYWRVIPVRSGKEICAWMAIQREGSVI